MAQVQWLNQALKNVEDIVAYIAKDSKEYALKMHDRIFAAVERLEVIPESGWVIPEFGLEQYREIVVSSFRRIECFTDSMEQLYLSSRSFTGTAI